MMTIILILCLGILLVNMYFFKAVCKSNESINKTIDGLREKLSAVYERQNDIHKYLHTIHTDVQSNIRHTSDSKVELLDAIGNDITVKLDNTYKLLSTLNVEGAYTEANKNYESLDNRMELVSSKLNKVIKEYHELVDETKSWREKVANELSEIYGESIETRKAVISSKSKPTIKSNKTSNKDSKPAK